MGTKITICFWPSIIIALIALIANIVAVLLRKKLFSGPTRIFLTNLACGNIALLFSYVGPIIAGHSDKSNDIRTLALITIVGFLHNANFATIWAITAERFVAVKYPVKFNVYFSPKRRRKIIIFSWVFAFLLGLIIGALATFVASVAFPAIIIFCTVITFLSLVAVYGYIIYVKTRRRRRLNPTNEAIPTSVASVASTRKSKEQERREMYLILLAIGITSSFTFLNAPLLIYVLIYPDGFNLSCSTPRGILFNTGYALRALSKLTDPLLYFYVAYRLKQSRVSTTNAPISTVNVNNHRISAINTTAVSH